MNLSVKTHDGRTFEIPEVGDDDTIESIMERIEQHEGIPVGHHYSLTFDGEELEDTEQTVAYYGLGDTEPVFLVPPSWSCCCAYCSSIYINVEMVVGRSIILDVDPLNTVDTVRDKISAHQRLFFDGEQLEDGRTLASQGIGKGSTLSLDFGMHVIVETTTGRLITLQVDPSDTISSVKEKAQGLQKVIYDGKKLEEDRTVTHYKIQTGSTLLLDRGNMQVTVKAKRSKTIRLKVKPSDTVGKAKEMIVLQQRITFEGKKLDKGQTTLSEYNILGGSTLRVKLSMNISVKTPKGQAIKLGALPSDTIHSVKKKVQRKQVLLYDDKELDDTQTLQDYGIQGNSTLYLGIGQKDRHLEH